MEQDPFAQKKKLEVEQDDYLEEALEETFPASDAISPGRARPKPEAEDTETLEFNGNSN